MPEPRRIRRLTAEDMPQVADDGPLPGWDVQEIPEEPEPVNDGLVAPTEVRRTTMEYSQTRKLMEGASKRVDTFKKQLMSMLETDGEEDSEGHRYFRFDDDPVPGFDKKGPLVGIKREKRVSQRLDPEKAEALAQKYKLDNVVITETITTIDEDALLGANYAGVIPDEELQDLYTESVTYAFVPLKDTKA